jgi:hypothetical protein
MYRSDGEDRSNSIFWNVFTINSFGPTIRQVASAFLEMIQMGMIHMKFQLDSFCLGFVRKTSSLVVYCLPVYKHIRRLVFVIVIIIYEEC